MAQEVRNLGYSEVKVENGRVTFQGEESAIPRANLWLRTADRVFIKMGEFEALTFDELFEKTKALPWEEWIPADGKFPIYKAKSVKSKLFSLSDCQSIVKKRWWKSLGGSIGSNGSRRQGRNIPSRYPF